MQSGEAELETWAVRGAEDEAFAALVPRSDVGIDPLCLEERAHPKVISRTEVLDDVTVGFARWIGRPDYSRALHSKQEVERGGGDVFKYFLHPTSLPPLFRWTTYYYILSLHHHTPFAFGSQAHVLNHQRVRLTTTSYLLLRMPA